VEAGVKTHQNLHRCMQDTASRAALQSGTRDGFFMACSRQLNLSTGCRTYCAACLGCVSLRLGQTVQAGPTDSVNCHSHCTVLLCTVRYCCAALLPALCTLTSSWRTMCTMPCHSLPTSVPSARDTYSASPRSTEGRASASPGTCRAAVHRQGHTSKWVSGPHL
jgi:hypothetical protein